MTPSCATQPLDLAARDVPDRHWAKRCGGQQFVADKLGSSAFFVAWCPLMFSQVGKAGAEAF